MSTIKVTNLQHDSSAAANISLTSTERVGVGTATPDNKLHVYAGDSSGSSHASAQLTIENSGNSALQFLAGTSSSSEIRFGDSGDNGAGSIAYVHSDNSLRFGTNNGVEKARILAAGGLTFNGDTAAANALDDYEEGTFTPILADHLSSANAATMTVQEGYYTKVGNVVTIQIQIVWSGKGSMGAGNNTRIYGIPFTAKNNTSGYYWPAPLTMSSGNSDFMAAQPGNEAVLVTILANSPTGELSTSYVSASGRLLVQYTYRTN